jgi:hypothetical protein
MTERADILLAVHEAIKTISTDHGYENTIGTTSPEWLNWEDVKAWPAAFVWAEGNETRVEGFSDSEECTMQMNLMAYIKTAKSGEAALLARESIIDDLRKMVRADRSWGGLATHTRITDVEVRSDGVEAAVRIALEIEYVYQP